MSNICSNGDWHEQMFIIYFDYEGGKKMKKFMEQNLGVIVFYSIIILGVLVLNFRFSYLNNNSNTINEQTTIALNK